jgi:hypothetical protein
MRSYQPLTGPGFKVSKRPGTIEEIRAEIQRRVGRPLKLPAIIPADRAHSMANWTLENWLGVPADVQEAIVAVMREMDVQEP